MAKLVSVLKGLSITLNIIFMLIGMVLLGGGIYLVVVGDRYSYLTGTIYTSGAVIIMLCGLGTVVVSILGICGSCCKKWIVLLIYTIVLGVIIAMQVVASGLGFGFKSQLTSQVSESLSDGIRNYRNPSASDYNPNVNNFIDIVQTTFKCCGDTSYLNWALSGYNVVVNGYPESCTSCESQCVPVLGVYSRGCNEELLNFVDASTIAIGTVGLVLAVIEIIGVVASLMLCIIYLNDKQIAKA